MRATRSLRTNLDHATVLVAVVACAAGCATPPPSTVEGVRPVKTMVVAAGDELRSRSFPGTVEASRRVELAFRVPGLVVNLPVREGQNVAAGEIIAELRQDEFEARFDSLRAQLDQARASLEALRRGERDEEVLRRESQVRAAAARLANARTHFDRQARLLSRSATARATYEAAETDYRVAREEHQAAIRMLEIGTVGREEDIEGAEAAVRALEGRLVEADIQRKDATLRAPFDGVIAQRFIDEGQNVQAKQPVIRFQDVDEVEIGVDVPETVMATDILRADMVSMVAELPGAPGVEFPVELREISQVADATTQTFKVAVSMRVPEGIRVLPGMTATVTATFRRADVLGERILVPVSSVAQQDAQSVVWTVDEAMVVARRPVTIGGVIGGRVEVVDGLAPGERIVIAGVHSLREGMQVRDLGDALGDALGGRRS